MGKKREEHWAIVDLVGRGGHIRTVPVPDRVRTELEDWSAAAVSPDESRQKVSAWFASPRLDRNIGTYYTFKSGRAIVTRLASNASHTIRADQGGIE